MSEIKTCEQYVLARLIEKENEVEELKTQVENLKNNLKETSENYQELMRKLSEISKIDFAYDNKTKVVYIDSQWASFNHDNFEYFSKFVTPDNDLTTKPRQVEEEVEEEEVAEDTETE